MARQPIKIGDLDFPTKKAAKAHFQDMLGRYRDGQTVSDRDAGQLHELIERHPEAIHKIGCGIARFFKDKTDMPTSPQTSVYFRSLQRVERWRGRRKIAPAAAGGLMRSFRGVRFFMPLSCHNI